MQSQLPAAPAALRFLTRFAVLLALMLGLAASVRADITLTFTQHDSDKVSDIAKILVKADSKDGIDKVEFLVDGQTRTTKGGIPYFFDWDTIADAEGPHTITAIAYDSNGVTKKAEIKLVIDNELGMGAGPLAQQAFDALSKKDYDTTLKYARRSLKAESDNAEGSRALAAVYAHREDWERANATLEKAKGLDSSTAALSDLADYKMRVAVEKENVPSFVSDYVMVSELRRKSSDILLKDLRAKAAAATGQDAIKANEAVGDALVNSGRFQEAASEYEKNTSGDDAPISSLNRLALAYALNDHFEEAEATGRVAIRAKKADAVTRAIYGLALLRHRKFQDAKAAVEKDLADKTPASLLVASYADGVLGNNKEAVAEAKSAMELLPDVPEAHYALALASLDLQLNERELRRTLVRQTAYSGPYLSFAANMVLSKRADRFDQALALTDAVLKTEPDNVYAQIIQSLVYLEQKQIKDAEKILAVLGRREKDAPDVLLTLGIYWDAKGNGTQARAAENRAHDMDIERFSYALIPTPMEFLDALNRKYHYRAGFFLSPASLYPPKVETTTTAAP